MSGRTIVLAHGVLGFGDFIPQFGFINYFNGVAEHLTSRGHTVSAPLVNPVGSVSQRAEQLAAEILNQARKGSRVDVLAHSMGGLDARHAITHIGGVSDHVATLVTIGTPHGGSPVADAIADHTDPLFARIPEPLLTVLQRSAGALQDLTTERCRRFDESTPDAPGVRYIDVAGDASRGGHELFLFQFAAVIGQLKGETNDGVVTRRSALRDGHEHLADWPVDHAGEIGWSVAALIPNLLGRTPAHLARYDDVVDAL